MSTKQLSIFLENKAGRVAKVTKKLAQEGVNISALVLSDTTDFGVLRLIVNDPEKGYNVLKQNGFTVNLTDVIITPMSYKAGSLSKVLNVLEKEEISIEYMYAFLGKVEGEAFSVLKIEDCKTAVEVLKQNGIEIITECEI